MNSASRGVLVTGASRGIGAAVAARFAAAGDRVAVHYRGARELAEQVMAGLDGEGHALVHADIADPDAVATMVADAARALGRIDVLVNNAALFTQETPGNRRLDHRIDRVAYADWVAAWRRTVEVNLLGTANVTWCVARHMLDVDPPSGQPRGRIVNVGSRGAFRGEPDVPAYGATKAGVHAMGQSLAVALGAHGIAVTAVAPGFVATDMASEVLGGPDGDAVRAQSPWRSRWLDSKRVALDDVDTDVLLRLLTSVPGGGAAWEPGWERVFDPRGPQHRVLGRDDQPPVGGNLGDVRVPAGA